MSQSREISLGYKPGRPAGFWERLTSGRLFTVQIIGLILLAVSLVIIVLGYINQHSDAYLPAPFVGDFYANFGTELISIALTVLVIDVLNQNRSRRELKDRLIRQLQSPMNGLALQALRELRENGWVEDGSLRVAYLRQANLQQAYLSKADLSDAWMRDANLTRAWLKGAVLDGASLVGANLERAKDLTSRQLAEAYMLLGATMPNGARYDGRFNLPGDLKGAQDRGFDPSDPAEMARFYGVSRPVYLAGQEKGALDEAADDFYDPDDWLEKYIDAPSARLAVGSDENRVDSAVRMKIVAAAAVILGVGWLIGRLGKRAEN